MRFPFTVSLFAALFLFLTVAVAPVRADDCDDLADALGSIAKGGELLALYFGDCKEIDVEKLKQVTKRIVAFGSLLAKLKKNFPKLYDKIRKQNPGLPLSRLAAGVPELPPENPKDDRIGWTGKDGFPLGAFDLAGVHTGPFDARVTLAVGPIGLEDVNGGGFFGGTGGIFRLDRPPFDENTNTNGVSTALIAEWNRAAQGFTVSATDNNLQPLGTPQVIADTVQVDLRFQQTPTTFSLFARKTPADHGSPDGWVTIFTTALAAPATPFSFGMVGRGLDQKATVVFDFFRLTGPEVGGPVERPLANQIGSTVIQPLINARDAVRAQSPDLAGASAALALVVSGAGNAEAAITTAQNAGTLQPSTEATLALKALGKVIKSATSAQKTADKGDPKKAANVEKTIVTAGGSAITAIADLFGISAKSVKDVPLGAPRP